MDGVNALIATTPNPYTSATTASPSVTAFDASKCLICKDGAKNRDGSFLIMADKEIAASARSTALKERHTSAERLNHPVAIPVRPVPASEMPNSEYKAATLLQRR